MTAPLTDDSFLASQVGNQTSRSGLITSTPVDQLAAAMHNPSSITGNPADNPAAPANQQRGIPNPYGLGLTAFEPNTTPYIAAVAGNSDIASAAGDAAIKDVATGQNPSQDTAQGNAPQGGPAPQVKDTKSASTGIGYSTGGIADATGKVRSMISAALQLAANNVPYVWGGTSASGVDCSGLIYYAAKSAGLDWKRYVANDYGRMGTRVTAQDARPGDIVYYDEGGGAGHVGIYLGNGMMVAAPQSGENVKVQKVYGTPTGYQRIFNDSQFGAVATPGGGSSYNYNGRAW